MGKSEKRDKKSKKKNKHKRKKEHKLKAPKKQVKAKKPKSPAKDDDVDFSVPVELMSNKSHAPETQEEYDRRQSVIRREVDPITGRVRLIKGDGEILEEIVSRDRHLDINKTATRSDASFFEKQATAKAKQPRK